MKVILLKDVRGLGTRHTVKDVSDGYATNYLLPQQLAEIATPQKLETLVAQQEAAQARAREEEAALDSTVAAAEGKEIKLTARATEKGGLFKTITTKDVVHGLREQHALTIPEDMVRMEPIKTTGEHPITLQGKHKKAHATVVVSQI